MTATPEAIDLPYTLIEEPGHVIAVDADDIEIVGARRPRGHEYWLVYSTFRLGGHAHQVIAPNAQIAVWHVQMLASLFMAGQR